MTVSDVFAVIVAFDGALASVFGCLLAVYLVERVVGWFRGFQERDHRD